MLDTADADADAWASAFLKLFADGYAIGVLTKTHQHQDHYQFKAAQLVALGNLF